MPGTATKAPQVKLDPSAVISAIGAKVTHGVLNSVAQLANVKKIGTVIHHGVIGTREFLMSLIVLVICIAFIVLIYVLVRVVRVRGFMVGHSENLEEFMKTFYNDIDVIRKLFQSLEASRSFFDTEHSNLLDLLHCNNTIQYFSSNDDATLDKNFDTYFKYFDIMHSDMDKWFYSKDIDTFAHGNQSGTNYLDNLIKSIDLVRNELKTSVKTKEYMPTVQRVVFLCSSISEDDYKNARVTTTETALNADASFAQSFVKSSNTRNVPYAAFKTYVQQFIDMCIGVQLMNLYLNVYFDNIKELHNSRRFSFFNFLIVLVKPYVKQLIFEKIVDPWKQLTSPKGRLKQWNAFMKAWKSIGQNLKDLPANLATSDPDKLKTVKKPKISNSASTQDNADTEDAEDDGNDDSNEGGASGNNGDGNGSGGGGDDGGGGGGGIAGLFMGIILLGNFFSTIMNVAKALANLV